MGTLSSLRHSVAECIENAGVAGLVVQAYPDRINPPVALVTHDEPFMMLDESFAGSWNVGVRVAVIGKGGVDEVSATQLDDLLEQVVVALAEEFIITEVSAPGVLEVRRNGKDESHFGSIIRIEARQIMLREE